jgi:lipopolysaccharide export LptBFGC system permease protein LptF
MQRRWAAICLAFFLVTASGAYAVMAVAEEPSLDLEGDTYQENDTLETNGTTYTFTGKTFTYNVTQEKETTWQNGSTVAYEDGEYDVVIESGNQSDEFALVETFDVEAILQNDSDVDNQTYESDDGTQFVRYRNGTTQPLEEYLPERDVQTFTVGDTLTHEEETKTVDNVTAEEVTLVWEAEVAKEAGAKEGEVFELGGTEYVATYPQEGTVLITQDVEEYQRQVDNQKYFQERMSGLNYVIIFSLGTAFLLTALAFMPRRG